jgi:hypothetical protein
MTAIATRSTTLAALADVLPGVLAELKALDLAKRPFVVVDDVVTKRFVQFGRVVQGRPDIAPVGEMAFDVPALGIYLRGFGNDPAEGARLAVETLRQWLPDEAALVITLDGEPLS